MWLFVTLAIVLFLQPGGPPQWAAAAVAFAAGIGTVAIVRWDTRVRRENP